jgi:DNA excision repair protein ERCC-4
MRLQRSFEISRYVNNRNFKFNRLCLTRSLLQSSHDEPDVEAAVLVGAESVDDVNSMTNLTPQEILRSMPGINSKNYRLVMSKVENIEELSKLSIDDLKEIVGREAGSKLHHFLHKRE